MLGTININLIKIEIMEFKGTKGEWKIKLCDTNRSIIATNEKSLVDVWYGLSDSFPNKKEGKANAKLIASAPDLLEALQLAFKLELRNFDDRLEFLTKAKEAINKALN